MVSQQIRRELLAVMVLRYRAAFGAYYQRLVTRGMKKGMAVVTVMRKMLIVAVHLIKTAESYDPGKVAMQAGGSSLNG